MITKYLKVLPIIPVILVVVSLTLVADATMALDWKCSACSHENPSCASHCESCKKPKGATGGCPAPKTVTGAVGLHSGAMANNMILPTMGGSTQDFVQHLLANNPELQQFVDNFAPPGQNQASVAPQPTLGSSVRSAFNIVTSIIGAVTNVVYQQLTMPAELRALLAITSNPLAVESFQSLVLDLNHLPDFQRFESHQVAIEQGMLAFYEQDPEGNLMLLYNDVLKTFNSIWQAVLQYNLLLMTSAGSQIDQRLLSVLIQLQLTRNLVSPQQALDLLQANVPDPNVQLSVLIHQQMVQSMSNINLVYELDCQQVDSLEHLLTTLSSVLLNPGHNQSHPYLVQLSFFAYYSIGGRMQTAAVLPVYILWFQGQYRVQVGSYVSPPVNFQQLSEILKHLYIASKKLRDERYGEFGISSFEPVAQICPQMPVASNNPPLENAPPINDNDPPLEHSDDEGGD